MTRRSAKTRASSDDRVTRLASWSTPGSRQIYSSELETRDRRASRSPLRPGSRRGNTTSFRCERSRTGRSACCDREFYRPHARWSRTHLRTSLNRAHARGLVHGRRPHCGIRPPRQPSAEIATVGFCRCRPAGAPRGSPEPRSARQGDPRAHLLRRRDDTATYRALDRPVRPAVDALQAPSGGRGARSRTTSSRWTPGPPEVLYDEVEVEDITRPAARRHARSSASTSRRRTTSSPRAASCTTAVLPATATRCRRRSTTCQDYLFRQLELIEPKVVCTLGNFATKLLRGDPTGITRLHGRAEVRQLGPRRVRLFPIYHPAAALYTPAMLATLRADFERVRRAAGATGARPARAGARTGRPGARACLGPRAEHSRAVSLDPHRAWPLRARTLRGPSAAGPRRSRCVLSYNDEP